jgi:uncharacterized protein involved in exopolysaccharide biosynthesis
LQLHRKLALFVALAGISLSLLYFFRLWPVYEAQSLVYVQPASPRVMDQGGQARWPYDGSTYETYIQQQTTNVTRPDVLANALHKLEPGVWQQSGESDQAAAERLGHSIEVLRNGAYQLSIGVRASKPELAAELANAVTNSYIEVSAKDSKAGDSQRLAILREEQVRVQNELNADRAEQATLSRQLGVVSAGPTAPDVLDDEIGRTRAELVKARTDHDVAAATFASMGAGAGASSTAIEAQAEEIAANDVGLASMKTSLNQRRAALISQMANLTPSHPQYKQDAAELDKINGTIDSMMHDLHGKAAGRIQQKLRSDLQRTAGVEDQLNAQLRQLIGTAGGAGAKLQRANDLAADITRLQARYSNVDEQMHNLMLEVGGPGSVFLTAAAVPPLHPAKSGVIRNTAVLLAASILFGLFVAVLAHKMDPRVYIASDVENLLGFAPMAQLPDFGEVSEEVADQHFFRLACALDHAARQANLHTVVVTGASDGAGVSTIVKRLRLMTETAPAAATGAQPAQAHSLAQSPAVSGPLQVGFAIADAAPLLVSAEAEYQARLSKCTIVVIESGVTTRAQLRATANELKRLDVETVGFVLNRIGMSKADPAFRHSVRDAERHLRSRGSSRFARSTHDRFFAEPEPAPTPEPMEQLSAPAPASTASEASLPRVAPAVAAAAAAIPSLAEPQHNAPGPWWLSGLPQELATPSPIPVTRPPVSESLYGQPAAEFADAYRRPPAAPATGPAYAEVPAARPSRLEGLRNVLFHHGLEDLETAGEPAEPAPELYAVPPRAPQPATPFPKAAPARSAAPSAPQPREIRFTPSAREVVAKPEFLPPREFIPVRGEGSVDDDGDTRHDRRDPYDEVDILPSWRGQYKKKS